jgi:short chain dehydrogenase
MNPIYNFQGQVALVTGATMGMGLATARAFAESGAFVVLTDLDGDLATKEAERIVGEGGTAISVACDVADETQVAAAIDRAVAEYADSIWPLTMPASRCRQATPRTNRSKPCLGLHEARASRDARAGIGRNRKLLVARRARRPAAARRLSRH